MKPTHLSPQSPFPLHRINWLISSGLAAILIVAVVIFWPQGQRQVAQAKSSYLSSFVNTYPSTAGAQLDSCHTCHTSVPNRNPYGQDYKSHGHNFQAIELLDSDGDGYSNIDEINALTLPGDPNSHPGAQPTSTPPPSGTPNPPPANGQYQLIGWNDLGMHCMNESFADLAILPPYNTLWAQLIRVGSEPEIVTDNVVIEYSFQNNTTSSDKIDFWNYADQIFGVALQPDEGLTGARLTGNMNPMGDYFTIEGVPLTPYEDNSGHVAQPYQLADLVAKDATTGEVLARTTFVAPVSTEMHCDDCHVDGMEGIATGKTETNILALHDKEEGTNLMAQRPVLCANCHGSNALGMPGDPHLPSLSRAIHKKHGGEGDGGGDDDCDNDGIPNNIDPDGDCGGDDDGVILGIPNSAQEDAKAECYQCHPGPQTKCLRGTMAAAGMTCQSCHGSIQDVANKNREPWVDLPRCGNCHGDQYAEEPGKLFRQSKGHGGLYCESCHGSTHAILPSTEARDNIQVIRLQGYADILRECSVCHGDNVPDGPGPHGMANPNPHPTATPTFTPQPPTATPTHTPQPTATPSPQPGSIPLWLEPAHRSVSKGDTFTLIMKANGASIAGYEVTLRFDPTVIQAQDASLGNWLQGVARTASPLGPNINNAQGVIHFGAYSFGNGQPPAGESQLAMFTFKAISEGESQVHFDAFKLTDANAQEYVNVQASDASITVQRLQGDLNGDCIVDITDIMMVVAGWGTSEGDPNWDPSIDLNGDGVIDISDIMFVVSHWGESCQGANTGMHQSARDRHTSWKSPFHGTQSPVLALEPQTNIVSLTDNTFEVQLHVQDVQDMASFQAAITFDPQRVQLDEVRFSDWLASTGRQVIPLGPEVDNQAGRVVFGAVSFGDAPGLQGAGTLASIRFHASTAGDSPLDMSEVKMTDTRGAAFQPTIQSGYVRVLDKGSIYLPIVR